MIDAHEDKAGAPATPGLGKSTTAATNVDVHAHAVVLSLVADGAVDHEERLTGRSRRAPADRQALPLQAEPAAVALDALSAERLVAPE